MFELEGRAALLKAEEGRAVPWSGSDYVQWRESSWLGAVSALAVSAPGRQLGRCWGDAMHHHGKLRGPPGNQPGKYPVFIFFFPFLETVAERSKQIQLKNLHALCRREGFLRANTIEWSSCSNNIWILDVRLSLKAAATLHLATTTVQTHTCTHYVLSVRFFFFSCFPLDWILRGCSVYNLSYPYPLGQYCKAGAIMT